MQPQTITFRPLSGSSRTWPVHSGRHMSNALFFFSPQGHFTASRQIGHHFITEKSVFHWLFTVYCNLLQHFFSLILAVCVLFKWSCRRFFLKEYFSSFTRLNSSVDLRSWLITRESFFASHSVILFAAHNTDCPSSFHPSKFLQKFGNSTPPSHFSYIMSLPNKSQSELFLSTAHVCFQA